jgi:small subunit ribosomal protein S17
MKEVKVESRKQAIMTAKLETKESKLKTQTGVVVSKSGDKSIKVAIDFKVRHPKYGKYVKSRTKLGVHDQHNRSDVGDVVEIAQCQPFSKTKSWRLVKVLQKAVQK